MLDGKHLRIDAWTLLEWLGETKFMQGFLYSTWAKLGASGIRERYIDNFVCNMDLSSEFKSSSKWGVVPCQCPIKKDIFRPEKPLDRAFWICGDMLKFCLGFRHQKRLSRSLCKCLCKQIIILYSSIHTHLFCSGTNSDFQFMLIWKKK